MSEQIVGDDKEAFLNKVVQVCNQLGYNPNWLMPIMRIESKFNAQAKSPTEKNGKYAVGLIQFRQSTAKTLGTSQDALCQMERVKQLDYVFKYYDYWKNRGYVAKKAEDLYLITFQPAVFKLKEDYVLGSEKGQDTVKNIAVQMNLGYKGFATKQDFEAWYIQLIGRFLPQQDINNLKQTVVSNIKRAKKYIWWEIGGGALLFAGTITAFAIYEHRKNKYN